jgi:MFS family permease
LNAPGLLARRRFGPFFLTQFLGALNDNVYKQALISMISFGTISMGGLSAGVAVNLASGLFILPFFLFSATAGQLADRLDKARIIRAVKALEIGIMALAAAGFLSGRFALLLAALALMGVHSTFFGPVKYSILPQHLAPAELVGGNAWVEGGTFLAILIGTIAGGVLAALPDGFTRWVPLATLAVAGLGYLSSRAIPPAPPAAPGLPIGWNLWRETCRIIGQGGADPLVLRSVLAISWFWFYGAVFLAQAPLYAKDYLGGGQPAMVLLLTVFSLGIGAGSAACARLSGARLEPGLVPFGALGLSLFALDMVLGTPAPGVAAAGLVQILGRPASVRLLCDFLMIGVSGGVFIVPLYTLLQVRTAPAQLSRVIAANNILNALFMVVAALMGAGLLALGWRVPQLFALTAVLNLLACAWLCFASPEFLVGCAAWLLARAAGRPRIPGLDAMADRGAVVLLCRRGHPADPLLILAASGRPVRFVMPGALPGHPLLGFLYRRSGLIDPAGADPQAQALQALARGELVCLFLEEAAAAQDGQRLQGLLERLAGSGADAHRAGSVLPLALCRAPGRRTGRVDLRIGPALGTQAASLESLGAALRDLQGA